MHTIAPKRKKYIVLFMYMVLQRHIFATCLISLVIVHRAFFWINI